MVSVNLASAVGGDIVARLADDPILLCDVLYVLCRQQAEERKITDEDFGRGLAGDALGEATKAMLAELADFFREPQRSAVKEAVAMLGRLETRGVEIARIEMQKAEELAVSTASGSKGSSTNSPA